MTLRMKMTMSRLTDPATKRKSFQMWPNFFSIRTAYDYRKPKY